MRFGRFYRLGFALVAIAVNLSNSRVKPWYFPSSSRSSCASFPNFSAWRHPLKSSDFVGNTWYISSIYKTLSVSKSLTDAPAKRKSHGTVVQQLSTSTKPQKAQQEVGITYSKRSRITICSYYFQCIRVFLYRASIVLEIFNNLWLNLDVARDWSSNNLHYATKGITCCKTSPHLVKPCLCWTLLSCTPFWIRIVEFSSYLHFFRHSGDVKP